MMTIPIPTWVALTTYIVIVSLLVATSIKTGKTSLLQVLVAIGLTIFAALFMLAQISAIVAIILHASAFGMPGGGILLIFVLVVIVTAVFAKKIAILLIILEVAIMLVIFLTQVQAIGAILNTPLILTFPGLPGGFHLPSNIPLPSLPGGSPANPTPSGGDVPVH